MASSSQEQAPELPLPSPAQSCSTPDGEAVSPPLSQPATAVNSDLPSKGSAGVHSSSHTAPNMRVPWAGGFVDQAGSSFPMFPVLYPVPFPGYPGQLEEQQLQNAGIFAVPMVPVVGPLPGYFPSGLIPISCNALQNANLPGSSTIPSVSQPVERAIPAQAPEAAAAGPAQEGGPQFPPAFAVQAGQMPEGQRQIVRRFHVAFQIDLLLILKLAVVVFIFNQDGSRDRLFLLLFLAGLVYLYQTGALTPLLRWISQSAQRAMMPPPQQQPAQVPPAANVQFRGHVQGENAGANAAVQGGPVAPGADLAGAQVAAGNGADNLGGNREHVQQQPAPAPAPAAAAAAAPAPAPGAAWWGFLKEVQMLVVGFVTSLLPGFHQHMD